MSDASRDAADMMADLLQQEYKLHNDEWWLFSLDKPARPLEADEVEYAKERGLIRDPDHLNPAEGK